MLIIIVMPSTYIYSIAYLSRSGIVLLIMCICNKFAISVETFLQKQFIKGQYATEREQTQETHSSANQSLLSLKSSSDNSTKLEKLMYNRIAKKELFKTISKRHLKQHCKDFHVEMNCHKPSYRGLSKKYILSANVLSRNRLYAIIYLGLLIIKDKIQLADILRFIREGHLSYNSIDHFFPEALSNKQLNTKNYKARTMQMTSFGLREITAKIAVFLGISHLVPVQNLVDLCEQYCIELNLPGNVYFFYQWIFNKTTNKFAENNALLNVIGNTTLFENNLNIV